MRKVIASVFVSIDGVFEDPSWSMPFWNDEAAKYAGAQMDEAGALLLGRVTYEGMAPAWTARAEGADSGTRRMNALPKYVATRGAGIAPGTPEWNATFLTGDLASEVAELKRQGGGDLLVYGSGQLVNALLAHGLLDELRLWTLPVVQGKGRKLFDEDSPVTTLTPLGTTDLGGGALVHAYGPAAAPSAPSA
ncbi:dihydrofolate reductase family protein [Streptomyces sp. NBC_00249]|uniref:dihydrofolate reductase family protein n=1 Tax=Streptomyces sp. NBC_00249 TaxID=2975690 RepID=UPI002250D808|nr:dihydrofolate reductase family protein [Streptomyces sp. NBC_00249]MCX5199787.1 dihydrofolate reductase family protein [Streptomyces sp. NBC_00249]